MTPHTNRESRIEGAVAFESLELLWGPEGGGVGGGVFPFACLLIDLSYANLQSFQS